MDYNCSFSLPPWAFVKTKRRHPDDGYVDYRSIEVGSTPVNESQSHDVAHKVDTSRHDSAAEFICGELECTYLLRSPAEYEHHYNSAHVHVCSSCGVICPSERTLDLHITERHDPFFEVLKLRQPMFECFTEGCSSKFTLEEDRRQHLVNQHRYDPACLDVR